MGIYDLHDKLAIAHAVVGCIATLGTIPAAILIGRFCRSSQKWCRAHILLNSATALLITLTFGLGMGAVGSAHLGTQFNGPNSDLHHKAGLGVFLIVIAETLLGIAAHATPAGKKLSMGGKRHWVRWTHMFFGIAVAAMCYWLVWEGMHNEWEQMSDSATTVPEGVQILFWVIFSLEVCAYVLAVGNDMLRVLEVWLSPNASPYASSYNKMKENLPNSTVVV